MSQPSRTPISSRSWTTKQLASSCVGSFLVGVVVLYGTGFHWLGEWQTGEEVEQKLAVAACVQDFLLQPNRGVMYADLKGTRSAYQRRQLIQKSNLAASREVAELCDQRIQAFDPAQFEQPQEAEAETKQPA